MRIDKAKFSLYIPKWRVPEPRPRLILVGIDKADRTAAEPATLSRKVADKNPELKVNLIFADVTRDEQYTQTQRYNPIGET